MKGFSLIEIVVVMGIMVILSILILTNLTGRHNTTDLTTTANKIASVLREAQSDSMSQEKNVSWGVHFANATNTSFYALFTTSYSTATIVGYYRLASSIGFSTSTLASGSSTDIIFSQISGAASVSTSIGIYVITQPSYSSIISVASSGAVSY